MEEPNSPMNNDVDVNVLVGLYNQKLATIMNQNVLLEAKITTLKKDFEDEKNLLLKTNLELQQKLDGLVNPKKKTKVEDKYQKDTEFNE